MVGYFRESGNYFSNRLTTTLHPLTRDKAAAIKYIDAQRIKPLSYSIGLELPVRNLVMQACNGAEGQHLLSAYSRYYHKDSSQRGNSSIHNKVVGKAPREISDAASRTVEKMSKDKIPQDEIDAGVVGLLYEHDSVLLLGSQNTYGKTLAGYVNIESRTIAAPECVTIPDSLLAKYHMTVLSDAGELYKDGMKKYAIHSLMGMNQIEKDTRMDVRIVHRLFVEVPRGSGASQVNIWCSRFSHQNTLNRHGILLNIYDEMLKNELISCRVADVAHTAERTSAAERGNTKFIGLGSDAFLGSEKKVSLRGSAGNKVFTKTEVSLSEYKDRNILCIIPANINSVHEDWGIEGKRFSGMYEMLLRYFTECNLDAFADERLIKLAELDKLVASYLTMDNLDIIQSSSVRRNNTLDISELINRMAQDLDGMEATATWAIGYMYPGYAVPEYTEAVVSGDILTKHTPSMSLLGWLYGKNGSDKLYVVTTADDIFEWNPTAYNKPEITEKYKHGDITLDEITVRNLTEDDFAGNYFRSDEFRGSWYNGRVSWYNGIYTWGERITAMNYAMHTSAWEGYKSYHSNKPDTYRFNKKLTGTKELINTLRKEGISVSEYRQGSGIISCYSDIGRLWEQSMSRDCLLGYNIYAVRGGRMSHFTPNRHMLLW